MAITREELKKLGLEDESITKVLDLHHAEINPLKEKADKYEQEKERADKLKTDFEAQAKKLSGLEKLAGNEQALKDEIEKLKNEAAQKEQEHETAINEMKAKADEADFNRILDGVLSGAKAKRKQAVIAELKLDDLRQSKNREADIKKAVDDLVHGEDTAFLFDSSEPQATGNKVSFPGGTKGNAADVATAQARAVMGLSSEEK